VKNNVKQRRMNLKFSVVLNKAKLPEFVHKEADARAARLTLFSEVCKQQKNSGQPLLAGIKKLIDKVFLDAPVPQQQVFDKELGKKRVRREG
jgi:hypothetical protein